MENYERNDQVLQHWGEQNVSSEAGSGSKSGSGFFVNFESTTGLAFGENQGNSYRNALASSEGMNRSDK